MAIATKDMGNIAVRAGIMKVTVYYDDTTISSSTHIPTAKNSFVSMGDMVERMEESAATITVGEMNIALREDYSNYAAGVWFKIFQGSEVQFRFFLDEGAGDTYYFWGYVSKSKGKGSINFTELFVKNPGTTGKYLRGAQIKLLSIQRKIVDVSMTDLIPNLQDMGADYLVGTTYCSNVKRIFGCFVRAGIGVGGYNPALSIEMPSSGFPFEYYNSTVGWKNINDLYIAWLASGPTMNHYFNDGYNSSPTNYRWSAKYAPSELLKFLCFNLGVIPRYWYDVANSRHMLTMQVRGADGNQLTMEREVRPSSISMINDIRTRNVKTIRSSDDTYFSVKDVNAKSIDTSFSLDFIIGAAGTFPTSVGWWEQFFHVASSTKYEFSKIRFYDKGYATMVEGEGSPTIDNSLINGRKYFEAVYVDNGGCIVKRSYKSLRASNDGGTTFTHAVVKPGCWTQIHDGISNKSYYANEVRKNAWKNEMSIEWTKV